VTYQTNLTRDDQSGRTLTRNAGGRRNQLGGGGGGRFRKHRRKHQQMGKNGGQNVFRGRRQTGEGGGKGRKRNGIGTRVLFRRTVEIRGINKSKTHIKKKRGSPGREHRKGAGFRLQVGQTNGAKNNLKKRQKEKGRLVKKGDEKEVER